LFIVTEHPDFEFSQGYSSSAASILRGNLKLFFSFFGSAFYIGLL